jgi:hypothetical protein
MSRSTWLSQPTERCNWPANCCNVRPRAWRRLRRSAPKIGLGGAVVCIGGESREKFHYFFTMNRLRENSKRNFTPFEKTAPKPRDPF